MSGNQAETGCPIGYELLAMTEFEEKKADLLNLAADRNPLLKMRAKIFVFGFACQNYFERFRVYFHAYWRSRDCAWKKAVKRKKY